MYGQGAGGVGGGGRECAGEHVRVRAGEVRFSAGQVEGAAFDYYPHLDTQTERKVELELTKPLHGSPVVVVAHRGAQIMRAVALIKRGVVVEDAFVDEAEDGVVGPVHDVPDVGEVD